MEANVVLSTISISNESVERVVGGLVKLCIVKPILSCSFIISTLYAKVNAKTIVFGPLANVHSIKEIRFLSVDSQAKSD